MARKHTRRALILATINNKGGCGKTCTAQNIAAALRLEGLNVLTVDTDGQANLTACFGLGGDTAEGQQFYKAMKGQAGTVRPVPVLPADGTAGRLDIIPAVEDLAALNAELSTDPRRAQRLGALLEPLRAQYDYILIDTPPAADLLTINAMYATDGAIITTQPQPLAVAGLLKVRDRLQIIAQNRGRALPCLVLITQFDRRKSLHRMTADAIQGAGLDICPVTVRECIALAEATACSRDIFRYAPRSNGAEDYRAAAAAVFNKF